MSLEMYSPDNILHQDFIKEIMKDGSVQDFLGNIDSQTYLKDGFLLKNETDYVGFITHSPIVDTRVGKTVSVYYAISPRYQHLGYGTVMLNLFTETFAAMYSLDKFILNIKKENLSSQQVALKCGFQCVYEDDENQMYCKDAVREKKL